MTFTNVTTKHTTTSSAYIFVYSFVNSLYSQKNDKEIRTKTKRKLQNNNRTDLE